MSKKHELYLAAVKADEQFSAALDEEYPNDHHGDVRYMPYWKMLPKSKKACLEYQAACEALRLHVDDSALKSR